MSKSASLNKSQTEILHNYLKTAIFSFINEAIVPADKENSVIPLRNAGIYIEDLNEYLSGTNTNKLPEIIDVLSPFKGSIPQSFKALEAFKDLADNGINSETAKTLFGDLASRTIPNEAFQQSFATLTNQIFTSLQHAYDTAPLGITRAAQKELAANALNVAKEEALKTSTASLPERTSILDAVISGSHQSSHFSL